MAFTRSINNLIPILSSNTSASGYVASESGCINSDYGAWTAMNGTSNSGADCWCVHATTGWMAIQFPSMSVVNSYNICNQMGYTIRSPKAWTVDGYTGSTWDVLDTQTNITSWVDLTMKTFTFSNSAAFIIFAQ